MPYFYHANDTNLVWSVYILLAILGRRISGFGTPVLLVKYNIDRDQKKPVSTIFIRGNEITQKMCARSLISSNSRSECQWKTNWVTPNRLTSTIRISHSELINDLALSEVVFAVSGLLLPWVICFSAVSELLFLWVICFCKFREHHSENIIQVNTRAKGNPEKAVREAFAKVRSSLYTLVHLQMQ